MYLTAKEVHKEDQNTTLQQNKLMYFAALACSGQLLQSVYVLVPGLCPEEEYNFVFLITMRLMKRNLIEM